MTLAVAANLERLTRNDRRFVLLMTDSRFTYTRGSYRDDGAKVWKLASKVGAVFAGDVEIGEKSLSFAQRLILRAPAITFKVISERLQIAVERLYRKNRPTHFVVGAVSPNGEARIFIIDHEHGPHPHDFTNKLVAIGDQKAQAAFMTELSRIPEGPLHQLGKDSLAEFHLHALPYVSTFARALVQGGETVGYPMQVMLITEFGEETLQLLGLENSVAKRFKKLTTGPGEVVSLFRQQERIRLPHRMRIRVKQVNTK